MTLQNNITIDFLNHHPHTIPELAKIWYDGEDRKQLLPNMKFEEACQKFSNSKKNALPTTLIALLNNQPVGMCSLRENDGIRADLKPWLGSLVVHPSFQGKGIGNLLIQAIKQLAADRGFKKLYLFALKPTLPEYYSRLGWQNIGKDEFKGFPVLVMEYVLTHCKTKLDKCS